MHGFQGFQPTKAVPMYTPTRSAMLSVMLSPACGWLLTRCHGIVDRAIHAAQVAFVDIVLSSKITHFPGNLGRISCASKRVIWLMPDTPSERLFPDGINGRGPGGNRPESSDHHHVSPWAPLLHYFPGWLTYYPKE
jgi:hypothetical protein